MLDLTGKVAIVTGAGSIGPTGSKIFGNGKATATLLARAGGLGVPGGHQRGGGGRHAIDHRGRGRHLCDASLRHDGGGGRAGDGAGVPRAGSSGSISW